MKLCCDIGLPASKSESHRALMIAAYGGFEPDFLNLSDANDTRILAGALREIRQGRPVIDIADCGTAARFLTTFLACREGRWLLTGTRRMKQRPVKPLVDALLNLGAEIRFVGEEGFLPLQILGRPVSGGKVALDMSQSSQFASSLLLAAPMWPQGLELELLGELNSLPYLDMTLAMMRHFGAEAGRDGRKVVVRPKPYQPTGFEVASDWSAASYWYEMAALGDDSRVVLNGRFGRSGDKVPRLAGNPALPRSLQGDSVIAEWMESLGVHTSVEGNSLVLRKLPFERRTFAFDFSQAPDLFPTVVATCAGLQLEACFTGIANLRQKESDRVGAMQDELAKIGAKLDAVSGCGLVLKPSPELPFFGEASPLRFSVHGDHRVAMALAPLSLKVGFVSFDDLEVVAKSYPDFWQKVPFLSLRTNFF